MSNHRKRTLRSIALALVLMFSAGPLSSVALAAPGSSGLESLKESNRETAMAKIETDLKKDLVEQDTAKAIIYLKAKLDSESLASATRNSLSNVMTPQAVNDVIARKVVEGLRSTAEESQAGILEYLTQEQTRGNVVEFESFHVANVIYVEATQGVIENLAFRGEVQEIFKMKTHTMEKPVVTEGSQVSTDSVQWNISRVKADQVWELGIDGRGTVIGSLDSGVDWTHPALKEKWRGYDKATGETDAAGNWFDPIYNAALPADSDAHGTHVMGTAVGQEPDGSNPIGVAPGAQWIAARVFDVSGSTTDAILLAAAEWMLAPGGNVDLRPDVVNNSWGGGAGLDDWYRDSVINWRAAGIFPVFSAGNQRTGEPAPGPGSISVPSNYPESFAVGATDSNDIRAGFSKMGPSPFDETLWKPNISAPGVNIYSSIPGGYTSTYSGTSMAAPHVAGVAALLKSANASLTVDAIEEIIQDTAKGLTDGTFPKSPNFGYGYGMVDAMEAVSMVASGITGEVTRLSGANRLLTAVEASKAGFDSADTVVLVNGFNFPDALAGAPLAGIYDAPILLTERDQVDPAVLAEIQRLGAEKIILLGGELVISAELEEQLSDYTVERIAGDNRILTAAQIAERVVEDSGSKTAFLVNGFVFPDGLTIGSPAAIAGSPVLFTGKDTLPKETLDALTDMDIENVTIVGGTFVVSPDVEAKLVSEGFKVDRIEGATRYETALEVAEQMFETPRYVIIATGANFPDALAGGSLATNFNAPLLLVQEDEVTEDVLNYLTAKGVKKVFVLGGEAIISNAVLQAIEDAIN